jgi:hypothetical protein
MQDFYVDNHANSRFSPMNDESFFEQQKNRFFSNHQQKKK